MAIMKPEVIERVRAIYEAASRGDLAMAAELHSKAPLITHEVSAVVSEIRAHRAMAVRYIMDQLHYSSIMYSGFWGTSPGNSRANDEQKKILLANSRYSARRLLINGEAFISASQALGFAPESLIAGERRFESIPGALMAAGMPGVAMDGAEFEKWTRVERGPDHPLITIESQAKVYLECYQTEIQCWGGV